MENVNNGELRDNIVIADCHYGFLLYKSDNNLIIGNIFTNRASVRFADSNNNRMYLNDLDSTTISLFFVNSTNSYSSPSMLTYVYQGNTFTNYLGNYWRDYNGNDANNDGIGDSSVIFTDSVTQIVDKYPLMNYIENYEIITSAIPGYDLLILTIRIFGFILILVIKMRKFSLGKI
jgi:parallel beta-helix repeat protein